MARWSFSSTGNEVVDAFKDRVKGKTILVTGTSPNSIGAETALSLATGLPSALILTGRSLSKLTPIISQIKKLSPTTTIHFVELDLGSQKSVRNAVKEIEGKVEKIDILIHSAGIMVTPFELKGDWGSGGIEGQFATNYLGGFLLVVGLMGLVLKGGGGRVVVLSSSAHRMGGVRFEDVNFEDGKVYNEWEAYAQSKTALVLFAHALARKLGNRGLFAYSLDPGSISSNLQVNMFAKEGLLQDGLARAKAVVEKEGREWIRPLQKTPQQGCSTTLVAALDPEIEGHNGEYLADGIVAEFPPPVFATSVENQEKLWKLTEELIGEKFDW